VALRIAYLLLARVLSCWCCSPDPTQPRTSRSWCSDPRFDFRGPSAAPAPGFAAERVSGLAGAAGRSTAGDETGVPASGSSRLRVLTGALVLSGQTSATRPFAKGELASFWPFTDPLRSGGKPGRLSVSPSPNSIIVDLVAPGGAGPDPVLTDPSGGAFCALPNTIIGKRT
jgi:hypothetical protein